MSVFKSLILLMAVFGLSAATAEWKTVRVGGSPDSTIDVPIAVTNTQPLTEEADDLMFFAVSGGETSRLSCGVFRTAYPLDTTLASFAAGLATEARDSFCAREGVKTNIKESRSFIHNGRQAGICTASYADKSAKLLGQVTSTMVISAPDMIYYLVCTVSNKDEGAALTDWSQFWREKVTYIQNSLHLAR